MPYRTGGTGMPPRGQPVVGRSRTGTTICSPFTAALRADGLVATQVLDGLLIREYVTAVLVPAVP